MKKKVGIGIVLLIILLSSYFLLINRLNILTVNNISINTVSIGNMAENELAKNLISGINEAAISSEMVEAFSNSFIEIKNIFGITKHYVFTFDPQNNILYFIYKDKLYIVNNEFTEAILSDYHFEYMFKSRKISAPIVKVNDNEIESTFTYDWNYRKTGEENYNYSDSLIEENTYDILNKEDNISIELSIIPENIKLRQTSGELTTEIDTFVIDGSRIIVDIPDVDDIYTYNLEVSWNTRNYNGILMVEIDINADYPPEFTLDKREITQGEFAKIVVKNADESDELFINQDLDKNSNFIKNGKNYICLIPSSYYTKPAEYNINYGSNEKEFNETISVKNRAFNTQYLVINETTAKNTKNATANAEFNKYCVPAVEVSNFENTEEITEFILPTKGRLSTEFGVTRHVNGALISYNHSGLDIAAPSGTEVLSTADGFITLSRTMILTGNTIIIDHGNGLFSSYYHMNTRKFETGEVVKKGDIIGTIGTTGFSTGPHLHFKISYFNKNLEPGYFIYNEPVTYENYKTLFEM